MLLVKAEPSFPAMTLAENPSLLRSFRHFRRFSVQLAMRSSNPAASSAPALTCVNGHAQRGENTSVPLRPKSGLKQAPKKKGGSAAPEVGSLSGLAAERG